MIETHEKLKVKTPGGSQPTLKKLSMTKVLLKLTCANLPLDTNQAKSLAGVLN